MTFERFGTGTKDVLLKTPLNRTTIGVSTILRMGTEQNGNPASFRVEVAGTGAVTATVKLMGSTVDDTAKGIELATFSLSGTDLDQAGTLLDGGWPYVWYDLTAITGTAATVVGEVTVSG